MGKTIRQYRYYGIENNKNQPSSINRAKLASGSIFFADAGLGAITQLGIQTLPGTKFYLNMSPTPVIIGQTGIYELDLNGGVEITALSFEDSSLGIIETLNNGYLIVDAIYEAEE